MKVPKMFIFYVYSCHDLLIKMKMKDLKRELDTILSYGIENLSKVDKKEEIYFLRFCQSLYYGETENYQVALDFLSGNYKDEALWLKDFWEKLFEIKLNEFVKHSPDIQILVIDKLFSNGCFNIIIELYNGFIIKKDEIALAETVCNQLKYYCGLSMFNIRNYDERY